MSVAVRYQCGWCPLMLPDDHVEWYAHFLTVHHTDGYSIRHLYGFEDWDVAELEGAS